MPVSRTEKVSSWSAAAPSRRRALTESTTSPRSVNLTAFESRFRSTWRRRVTSPTIAAGVAVADQVREVQALLGGPRGHEVERPLDALPQVERLGLELELPRLDLGEVEDVVDDGQERVAALADDLRELALLVGQRGVQEEPAHPDHGVHRGPDLVAHRRQEGALGLVGRLGLPAGPEELGDVVIDPDHADLGAVDDHGHGRDLDVHQRAVLPGAPRDRADPLALERSAGCWRGPPRGPPGAPRGPPCGGRGPPPACTRRAARRRGSIPRPCCRGPWSRSPPGSSPRARPSTASGAGSPGRGPALWMASTDWAAKVWSVATTSGRERAPLAPDDDQAAEQPVFPDERQREERAHALPDQKRSHLGGDQLPLVLDVGDLDGFPDHAGATDGALAEPEGRGAQDFEVVRGDLVRGPRAEASAWPRRTRRRSRCRCRRARRRG